MSRANRLLLLVLAICAATCAPTGDAAVAEAMWRDHMQVIDDSIAAVPGGPPSSDRSQEEIAAAVSFFETATGIAVPGQYNVLGPMIERAEMITARQRWQEWKQRHEGRLRFDRVTQRVVVTP